MKMKTLALALTLLIAPPALAQVEDSTAQAAVGSARLNPYGTGGGFQVLLTNNGFSLGGYYHRGLFRNTSFSLEASLGVGKDEREAKFLSYFSGRSTIPNKRNYLLMMPIQAGIQHRLFSEEIEENFRPYVQLTAGPTLGWEYPYFRDCNGNGQYDARQLCSEDENDRERTYDAFSALPRGTFRFGVGGTLAVGAHFGYSRRMAQGVRIGYTFTYFNQPIALMEADVDGGTQRFFGTPSITITFGRLF